MHFLLIKQSYISKILKFTWLSSQKESSVMEESVIFLAVWGAFIFTLIFGSIQKGKKNRHYLRKEKQARRECHGREKLCGTIAPTTIGYVPKEILPYTRYIVEQMYKHFVTSVVINVKEGWKSLLKYKRNNLVAKQTKQTYLNINKL